MAACRTAAEAAAAPALWRMNRRRGGGGETLLSEKPMANAASGSNLLKLFQLRGRVVFDLYHYVKTNHKLPSYKLDAVAEHFVGDNKVDLPAKRMFELYRQGPAEKAQIAAYCIQDCDLPLRIMQHLKIVPSLVEMSRVTCTDLSDIITRGQQIKVYNLFTTFANEEGYVVNNQELREFEACPYMGAVVLDPVPGFHNCPISTLDFASLYPSIMQSENLCYSTLILPSRLEEVREMLGERRMAETLTPYKVEKETYWIVKSDTKRGVLPRILQRILTQRKAAKRAMAAASDLHEKALQNARQLALKVSANSCYGFFGVKKGMLPCLPIAALTTSVGRQMIATTKRRVVELFPGSQVIYGDTDSVMVKFPVEASMDGVRQSFEMGERASTEISKCFPPPHDLEMEKVYFPYVLLNKKRYAGMQYDHPDSAGKIDTKGLENVRRDTTAMLRTAYSEVQEAALRQRSEDAMLAALERWCGQLRRREVPLAQLVQSKQLAAKYASNNLPHVALAERLRARIRDEGLHQEPPRSGDRIDFLIVHRPGARKMFEKSEDPKYVVEHRLELDYEYYLLKQLWGPIERFIQPFPPEFVRSCTSLIHDTLRDIRNQHNRQHTMQHFFVTRPPAPSSSDTEPAPAKDDQVTDSAAAAAPAVPAAKRQKTITSLFGRRPHRKTTESS